MPRVLITGAAGFLGSHLCDKFIKEGFFVIGMDNLITGDLKNIEHLFKNPEEFSEAWNFGPENENLITVSTLVTKLIESYGEGNWKDTSNSKQLHEATLLSLDINKAKKILHWQPVLGINETIEYTTHWYKNYNSLNVMDLTKNQIKNYVNSWKLQNEK